jgi:predicted TPR repeat methyltransferase
MSHGASLDAAYFDGIFESDADPWDLATSPYEAEKFDETLKALGGRRHSAALEVGCAHGVLTERLAALCDSLLALDISVKAIAAARQRVGDRPGVTLERMTFPREAPTDQHFDLVVLSEVAYYWGVVDLDRASEWLKGHVRPDGQVILVHYTGETDYPHSGDGAVETLWQGVRQDFDVIRSDRHDRYRLDLWRRR